MKKTKPWEITRSVLPYSSVCRYPKNDATPLFLCVPSFGCAVSGGVGVGGAFVVCCVGSAVSSIGIGADFSPPPRATSVQAK
jgi:hypothetical protein